MWRLDLTNAPPRPTNQSNLRLLSRRVTRLTQAQAGFTNEFGVGMIIYKRNDNLNMGVKTIWPSGFLMLHRLNA